MGTESIIPFKAVEEFDLFWINIENRLYFLR